jgi:hypothetical protein
LDLELFLFQVQSVGLDPLVGVVTVNPPYSHSLLDQDAEEHLGVLGVTAYSADRDPERTVSESLERS